MHTKKKSCFGSSSLWIGLFNNQDFITYKNQLAKLIDKAVEQNEMISEASLLQMMGLPTNWKKITAYKKT